MINNIFNNIINRGTALLFESKDKILAAAQKRGQEEIMSKIPSPIDFENQLKNIQVNKQDSLLKAEQTYNNLIKILDKAIDKAENGKNGLVVIREKLDSIGSKLDTLQTLSDIIQPLIDLINGGLFPAIDAALTFSSGPLSNGLLINKLGEKKKDLKDLIKNGQGTLGSLPDVSTFFNKETQKLYTPLNKGISSLEEVIQKLEDLRALLVLIYTTFIELLPIPELNDEDNDNEILGNENLSDFLSKEENLSTVLSNTLGTGPGNEKTNSLVFRKF